MKLPVRALPRGARRREQPVSSTRRAGVASATSARSVREARRWSTAPISRRRDAADAERRVRRVVQLPDEHTHQRDQPRGNEGRKRRLRRVHQRHIVRVENGAVQRRERSGTHGHAVGVGASGSAAPRRVPGHPELSERHEESEHVVGCIGHDGRSRSQFHRARERRGAARRREKRAQIAHQLCR